MLTFLILAITITLTIASIVAVYRVTAARRARLAPRRGAPPVSVLKPLCGADDALEANLETFFRQRYDRFELVFGVQGDADPAIAVVRGLMERFPEVCARLVIHDGRRALNPKVSNLRAMLEAGAHDLVVISDSNVAAEPDYLAKMVGQLLAHPRVGVVTSLFAGVEEQTLGATLDNLHLNGLVAGSVAGSQVYTSQTGVVGKSMLFRRSVLAELGGLESVATVLAEDYVLGRMFQAAGYDVRLCQGVIGNVNQQTTVRAFFKRHLRWGLLRSRLTPLLYLFELLLNPMAMAILACLATANSWPLLIGLGLTMLRDALQWIRLRGAAGLAQALPFGPAKELAMIAVWALAPFQRRVGWRGRRFRVGAGTRLYAERTTGLPLPDGAGLKVEGSA